MVIIIVVVYDRFGVMFKNFPSLCSAQGGYMCGVYNRYTFKLGFLVVKWQFSTNKVWFVFLYKMFRCAKHEAQLVCFVQGL